MMNDPYFVLLGIYRKRITIEWNTLVDISRDVEYVGSFDKIHGIEIQHANNFLRDNEFITQTKGKDEHSITDKGKNYYGVEKLQRDEIKRKENNQDRLATSIRRLNTFLIISGIIALIATCVSTTYIVKDFYAKSHQETQKETYILSPHSLQLLQSIQQSQKR
jgi:hypothetical protein